MLIGFDCKQGKVKFDYCLTQCQDRCMSRRTATIFSNRRELLGDSITQLQMPTRTLWLMMTRDYYENPELIIDRTIGSLGHRYTDRDIIEGLKEERLNIDDVSGQFDYYDGPTKTLWDLKIWGAYKVKTVLASAISKLDVAIQVNYYRMLVEENLNFNVAKMKIEAWVKDSIGYAKRSGIDKKIYVIDIGHISNHWILKYIDLKKKARDEALKEDYATRCKYRENWAGKRCVRCPVLEFCKDIE